LEFTVESGQSRGTGLIAEVIVMMGWFGLMKWQGHGNGNLDLELVGLRSGACRFGD
jgi:hypothetical protein